MLAGWAYGAIYQQRTAALDGWLWHYEDRSSSPAAASAR
jgi:hypothetical protein